MSTSIPPQKVIEVMKKCGLNTEESVWLQTRTNKKTGQVSKIWIVYHRALEIVATAMGIRFDPPLIITHDQTANRVAICVTGHLGDNRTEWSFGEAAPNNCAKIPYPFAMAEKRAKDRVILKLVGLHGYVYSEEESDDFKDAKPNTGAIPPQPDIDEPMRALNIKAMKVHQLAANLQGFKDGEGRWLKFIGWLLDNAEADETKLLDKAAEILSGA